MKTRPAQHAAAFVLSLFMTLSIFSGVSALAGPDQADTVLARAEQAQQLPRS